MTGSCHTHEPAQERAKLMRELDQERQKARAKDQRARAKDKDAREQDETMQESANCFEKERGGGYEVTEKEGGGG